MPADQHDLVRQLAALDLADHGPGLHVRLLGRGQDEMDPHLSACGQPLELIGVGRIMTVYPSLQEALDASANHGA